MRQVDMFALGFAQNFAGLILVELGKRPGYGALRRASQTMFGERKPIFPTLSVEVQLGAPAAEADPGKKEDEDEGEPPPRGTDRTARQLLANLIGAFWDVTDETSLGQLATAIEAARASAQIPRGEAQMPIKDILARSSLFEIGTAIDTCTRFREVAAELVEIRIELMK